MKFIPESVGIIICLNCGCKMLIYLNCDQDECNDCASTNLVSKRYILDMEEEDNLVKIE